MPSAVIQSFAKKTNKSEKEVEDLYSRAKKIVKKEYPEVKEDSQDFYQLVIGILKKMVGVDEESSASTNLSSMGDYVYARRLGNVKKRDIKEEFYIYMESRKDK